MGAARFGHRTPGTVPGLPHPPITRAPHGGADDETPGLKARPESSGQPIAWPKSAPLNDDRAQRILDAVVRVSGVTGPKSDDLSSAVRWLLSELEKASSPEPASPKEERERYIYIQVALSKFVRKVGGTLEQTRHIWELAQQLYDLDHGIVGPALKPAGFGKGKTGDSSLVWGARGGVAMGLEALIRLGRASREDAAKAALRGFPRISRLMTAKSKNSVDAMLSWHTEFLRWQAGKGRIKNRYLTDQFRIGAEALELCAGSPALLGRFAQLYFDRASRI